MIKLYNTFGRKKQEFKPIQKGKASIYVCGPTVYDYAHIGNLRAYLFSDILRRILELNSYKVIQIMNITDVGHLTSDSDIGIDKMEKGAEREKISVWQLAEKYTKSFKENLKSLNIETPTKFVKATEHIQEEINFIKKIEKSGFTYKTKDGIYFDTAKLPDYGKLRGSKKTDDIGVSRIEANPEKKNPADFALWKFSPSSTAGNAKRQMEWDSPWGKGFPGWHIECSAMSTKYLGIEFDIHTGGIDHIATHHTNEIAQAEAAYGKIPANYWLHSEFLLVEGGKMAKSLGNFLTLSDITNKGFDPVAFRYLALTTHYRSKLNFTWGGLTAAQNALQNIRKMKENETKLSDLQRKEYIEKIHRALNDDLDTPKALAILHVAGDFSLWQEFESVFALEVEKQVEIPEQIKKMADDRDIARARKDYKKADKLRKEIEEKGFAVEDTPQGTKIN